MTMHCASICLSLTEINPQDHAYVDQDDPASGVAALPLIIAQCNVLISLTDETFLSRAWCCVEVMMMKTLIKSYGLHQPYEHIQPRSIFEGRGRTPQTLRKGPVQKEIVMAEKQLTLGEARPRVLFLERQSRFLGLAWHI